ncbi:hypothetical protein ABZ891_17815 [Streptomyces sp. NPDC047023]|uniref:hypothetical protein n=1 Tax=Streptomyces sp. NPDC047023 TaxID=3155139 RepID=UPI0034037042
MSDHVNDRVSIEALTALRTALAAHGITLPSLDLHLPSYAGRHGSPPLITLGNCSAATAQRIAAALAQP